MNVGIHAEMDNALQAMQRTADNLKYAQDEVQGLALAYSSRIFEYAPKNTLWLALNVSQIENITNPGKTSDVAYGVGPFSKLGYPNDKPPSGLIARFVKNHKKMRGGLPATARAAWWALTREGKDRLAADRMAGMYGSYGKPRYWQAIQEQNVPGPMGDNLPTRPYITLANNAIRHIVKRIDDLLGHP